MEVLVTTVRRAKLQSNCHHQRINSQFLQARCPSWRPTNSVLFLCNRKASCYMPASTLSLNTEHAWHNSLSLTLHCYYLAAVFQTKLARSVAAGKLACIVVHTPWTTKTERCTTSRLTPALAGTCLPSDHTHTHTHTVSHTDHTQWVNMYRSSYRPHTHTHTVSHTDHTQWVNMYMSSYRPHTHTQWVIETTHSESTCTFIQPQWAQLCGYITSKLVQQQFQSCTVNDNDIDCGWGLQQKPTARSQKIQYTKNKNGQWSSAKVTNELSQNVE